MLAEYARGAASWFGGAAREGPAHAKTIARHLPTIRKAQRLVGYPDSKLEQSVKLTVGGLRRERSVASRANEATAQAVRGAGHRAARV